MDKQSDSMTGVIIMNRRINASAIDILLVLSSLAKDMQDLRKLQQLILILGDVLNTDIHVISYI